VIRGIFALLRVSWRYWSRGESLSYQRRVPSYVERRKVSQFRIYEENK
jgi:hypothetical protein